MTRRTRKKDDGKTCLDTVGYFQNLAKEKERHLAFFPLGKCFSSRPGRKQ
jgi:hypothetical protein